MIKIVPYDPSWPAQFDAEAAGIRAVFGSHALQIEHVGSTAVPGLAAKPVIDIQVSVATLETHNTHAVLLARLGYVHVSHGDFDLVYPFFQKPANWPCTHHVHLCVFSGEQERRHLAFRDYLRDHRQVAEAYAELKRRLANEHDDATFESRERYALSKTQFVTSVLEQAFSAGYPRAART